MPFNMPIEKLFNNFAEAITYTPIGDTAIQISAIVSEYIHPVTMGNTYKVNADWVIFSVKRSDVDCPSYEDTITYDGRIYTISQLKIEKTYCDIYAFSNIRVSKK